jgi:hypothetical protein
VKRFCGALVLGVLAAMAGARRYFAITALTGYQLGLVSVFALVFLLTKAKLLVLHLHPRNGPCGRLATLRLRLTS